MLPLPDLPMASGAIVMATGIVALGALQRLAPATVGPLTIEMAVVWLYLAIAAVRSWRNGALLRTLTLPGESFALGTWVAGSSVLSQGLEVAGGVWRVGAGLLGVLAVLLWIWFLWVVAKRSGFLLRAPAGQHVTGQILLLTVATQAVALVAAAAAWVPHFLLTALILLGILFYLSALPLLGRRYLRLGAWSLAQDWADANCIIHGAASITGLAAVTASALPSIWIGRIWVWAVAMFVVVESLEVMRALVRVRLYGWRMGLFHYHVGQWTRVFTFGMFYAFTLHLPAADLSGTRLTLHDFILVYGPWPVLGLLLLQYLLLAGRLLPRDAARSPGMSGQS